jgi:hypothetical protein
MHRGAWSEVDSDAGALWGMVHIYLAVTLTPFLFICFQNTQVVVPESRYSSMYLILRDGPSRIATR